MQLAVTVTFLQSRLSSRPRRPRGRHSPAFHHLLRNFTYPIDFVRRSRRAGRRRSRAWPISRTPGSAGSYVGKRRERNQAHAQSFAEVGGRTGERHGTDPRVVRGRGFSRARGPLAGVFAPGVGRGRVAHRRAPIPYYAFKIVGRVVSRRPVPRARRAGTIPRASARASEHHVVRTICAPQHQSSAGRVRAVRGRPSVPRNARGWVARTETRRDSTGDLGGLVREATGSQAQ